MNIYLYFYIGFVIVTVLMFFTLRKFYPGYKNKISLKQFIIPLTIFQLYLLLLFSILFKTDYWNDIPPLNDLIIRNILFIGLFVGLKYRAQFVHNGLAFLILFQMLLGYNFYVLMTQFHLSTKVGLTIFLVFLIGIVVPEYISQRRANRQK